MRARLNRWEIESIIDAMDAVVNDGLFTVLAEEQVKAVLAKIRDADELIIVNNVTTLDEAFKEIES
jgi:hypothetical protein